MAETDPKTAGTEAEATQGAPVWGTMARALFFLVVGTALFYYLGQMSGKVRGVEQQANSAAKDVEGPKVAPGKGRSTPLPELPRLAPYPNAVSFSGGQVFLMNGVARRIATFGTHDRPNLVSDFYVKAWEEIGLTPFGKGDENFASAAAADTKSGLRFSVVAQWLEDSQVTVGHLSVSAIGPLDTGFQPTPLPLPEGTVPLMDMQTSDAGSPGNMVCHLLPMSSGNARTHFISKLCEAGWKYEETYSQPPDERGYSVLFFSHGTRLLTLTLDPVPGGKTSVVVNESIDLE